MKIKRKRRVKPSAVDNAEKILFEAGNFYLSRGMLQKSFEAFEACVMLDERNLSAVHNMGVAAAKAQKHEIAYDIFKHCAIVRPNDPFEVIPFCECARRSGHLREAQKAAEALLKMPNCDPFQAKLQMGLVCHEKGDLEEAEGWIDQCIELNPRNSSVRLNKTLLRMSFGNWQDWWEEYEDLLTWRNERIKEGALTKEKRWRGGKIDKPLLVISDQGAGDAIQLCRFFRRFEAVYGQKVVFFCSRNLASLMRGVSSVKEVVVEGENEYERSWLSDLPFCTLLGLMAILKISPENCSSEPYIAPNRHLMEEFRHKLGHDPDKVNVGLVWAGDPKHGNDHNRSMRLRDLESVFSMNSSEFSFYDFQVGPGQEQSREFRNIIRPASTYFRCFSDTAAACSLMDAVVSVDTSVAHLAGSIGVPTFLLLPNPPEWRWLTDGPTTPWYDSMILLRKNHPGGSWKDQAERCAEELHLLFKNKKNWQEQHAGTEQVTG